MKEWQRLPFSFNFCHNNPSLIYCNKYLAKIVKITVWTQSTQVHLNLIH